STEDTGEPAKLQRQVCLYAGSEPLNSYLAGALDRFYLKLRLTLENGDIYETQTAIIDRGEPQTLPEELTPSAAFAPSVLVRETNPFRYFGRYQLTVSEDATPEDISALLPDTLPVEVQLANGSSHVTKGTINCPVTWKPLSLSRLTAGSRVTIADAAEEIVVPGGTLLNTPMGIFQLNEPLTVGQYIITDEVELILNVVAKDEAPTGVLSAENTGLEVAFNLKPTGATAIRAYILPKDASEWTELPHPPLLESVNAQPSTANSGYTFVLDSNTEPYQSYLAAIAAGNDPTPFWVGLTIEGGVYNGKQLILTWPDTYDLPPDLPDIAGAGGNEANAGAGNRDDSNEEGQRPDLPREPEDKTEPPDTTSGGVTDADITNSDLPDTTGTPAQSSIAVQTESGTNENIMSAGVTSDHSINNAVTGNEEGPPADMPTLSAGTAVTAPPVSAAEKVRTDLQEKSDLTERPVRDTDGGSLGLFLPAAAAITVICVAAAAGRAMAFRKKR
ncbi:MAG: hypothetical protein K2O73_09565, partial [Lachnospiraceae bacterium]|nr:hypothetical protein [Lachnospiraceae bacterium]